MHLLWNSSFNSPSLLVFVAFSIHTTVVALFNAISKRQKEEHLAGEGSDKVQGTAKAAAIKGASRHAFLDMLKTGVTPVEGGTGNAGGGGGLDRAGAGSGVGRENNGDEKVTRPRACYVAVASGGDGASAGGVVIVINSLRAHFR